VWERTPLSGLVLLFLLAACGSASRSFCSTENGPIRVLFLGRVGGWGEPFWFMRPDPLFSFGFVQAELRTDFAALSPLQAASTEEAVKRMVRLYMPRSYSDLTSHFDVILFWHANRDAVGSHNTEMLARGVREGGMGLLMLGGWESFGGYGFPPWGETPIGKLLPTEDVVGGWLDDGQLIIDRPHNEFISSLPWKPTPDFNVRGTCHHNIVTVKNGAELLAHLDNAVQPDHPGMVTWQLESGARTFAFMVEIYHFYYWQYFVDLGSNLVIYVAGRPVPQDLELVHRVRAKISQISTRRALLLSLVEFCDSFGANTDPIMRRIDAIDEVVADTASLYLELRLEEAWDSYLKVDDMIEEAEGAAIEIKNRALLWVHLIEWLAVTATLMVCGFVLWTFMVRRRLYKRVRTTRVK